MDDKCYISFWFKTTQRTLYFAAQTRAGACTRT